MTLFTYSTLFYYTTTRVPYRRRPRHSKEGERQSCISSLVLYGVVRLGTEIESVSGRFTPYTFSSLRRPSDPRSSTGLFEGRSLRKLYESTSVSFHSCWSP